MKYVRDSATRGAAAASVAIFQDDNHIAFKKSGKLLYYVFWSSEFDVVLVVVAVTSRFLGPSFHTSLSLAPSSNSSETQIIGGVGIRVHFMQDPLSKFVLTLKKGW